MSDEQLMKQCNDHADLLAMVDKEVKPQQSTLPSQQLLRKAAEAIERLEADVKRLLEDAPGALIKEALSERMRTADAEARAEKAERERDDWHEIADIREDMLTEARAENERKDDALDKAAKQFRYYEKLHRAKGTVQALDKADRNKNMAELCEKALAAPAPEPKKCRRCKGRGYVARRTQKCTGSGPPKTCPRCGGKRVEPSTEREAERPKDWYCGRCSEVVPLGERCRICGATKRESGIA